MAEITSKTLLNKILLMDKCYHGAWKRACLAVKDGTLYYYSEGNLEQTRQLRVRVVPPTLRMAVVAACHASTMLGLIIAAHAIFEATSQLWWPGMGRDITTLVHSYAHYHLANATMHESAGPLLGLESDAPLDIIFIDYWSPGNRIIEKDGAKKVLMYTCCMTSFAVVAFTWGEINAEAVAMLSMESFFGPFGLPKLIVVDAKGIFVGMFSQLLQSLGIPVKQVAWENHKAIRN